MTPEELEGLQAVIGDLVKLSTELARKALAAEKVFLQHSPALFDEYALTIAALAKSESPSSLALSLEELRKKMN